MSATRTYAILEVSPEVYAEIRAKLVIAGYDHTLHGDDEREVIDMHGIALSEGTVVSTHFLPPA